MREMSHLGTLYASYVVQAETELAELAPVARRQIAEFGASKGNERLRKNALLTAQKARDLNARLLKYEHLSKKCNEHTQKLREIHEINMTVSAFGRLNRYLRRSDTAALMRGAEDAVADSEGVSKNISSIGDLLASSPAEGIEVTEEDLMRELEELAGAHVIMDAPKLVQLAEPAPNRVVTVQPAEYMRTLLAND